MIGQALAFPALDRFYRPRFVADIAIAIPEIEFCEIVQMEPAPRR
jgi:hypothetical protein